LPCVVYQGVIMVERIRLVSSLILVLAVVVGGGSLALFGVFLYIGPLYLVQMGWSEPRILAWDSLLSFVFFVQHSGLIRRSCSAQLARIIPSHYHGAFYAILSGMVLTMLVVFWQSTSTWLYALEGFPRWLVRGFFFLAMAGFAWGVHALRSLDPLGIAAIRAHRRGNPFAPPKFTVCGPYRWVRHPFYLFSILMIWSCPDVTADRLLLNILWTVWIYLGTFFEEADLVAEFGEVYRGYQLQVPRLIPWRLPLGS
jgi:methanethiol S-methyltransferase